MLRNQQQNRTDDPRVAVLVHMDGLGTPGLRDETWAAVVQQAGPGIPRRSTKRN